MPDFILNWKVTYKDGTELLQFEPDGKENKYNNIDRTKLEAFQLYTEKYQQLIHTLIIGEGQRLIFRRRVVTEQPSGDILYTIYLSGCQQTINGKNIQSVSHITENSIITAPEFLTIDRYSGKLVPMDIDPNQDK